MTRRNVPRWILLWGLNSVLLLFVKMVNDTLSTCGLSLYVSGLILLYPALYLGIRSGLPCIALTGLIADASTPITFGTSMLLFCTVFSLLLSLRSTLQRLNAWQLGLVFQLVNFVLYLSCFLCWISQHLYSYYFGTAFFLNLIISQVCVAISCKSFFNLQKTVCRR